MHIRKLKHCCMVIDVGKTRIVTDPGFYSIEEHAHIKHVGVVLITHEHTDHFHIESLEAMVKHFPDVSIITNDAVGEILAKDGIKHHIMRHGDAIDMKGVHIEAYGRDHAVMHSSIPVVSNIGFFLENKLFFPGDALTDPGRQIDVLALPVAGPWLKLSESIDYALKLKPRLAFPVHDGQRGSSQHLLPEKVLGANGIEFIRLEDGGELDVK